MSKMSKCPNCGGKVRLVKEEREHSIRRRRVMVPQEFYRCDDCGEEYFSAAQADALHNAAIDELRKREPFVAAADIRALRDRLELTQPQFEKLLGVGKNTVARWESGAIVPNAATIALLRLLEADPKNVQRLAEMHGVEIEAA